MVVNLMGGHSLLSWVGFALFLPSIVALGLKETWKSMCRGRGSSPAPASKWQDKWQRRGCGFPRRETFPWTIGFALESTSSPNLCHLLLDGGLSGFAGIQLSVVPLFWLWDWSFPDLELSLSPQPLLSRVPCDGLIIHSDTFPLPADNTRERLLHPGSDSAWLRKHDTGQPANCSSAGQNTHYSPCSPAVWPLTPDRQAPLSGSGESLDLLEYPWGQMCRQVCASVPACPCGLAGPATVRL